MDTLSSKLPQQSLLGRRRSLDCCLKLDIDHFESIPRLNLEWRDCSISQCGGQKFAASYETGPIIGSGTLSVVRRARRRTDSRKCVAKCIRSDDEEVRQVTRMEFEILSSLQHPAIVQVLDLYEDCSHMWLCMELCENGDIGSYVGSHGAFAESTAQNLMLQLLKGVNYLHHKRIVHRDIKPDNLALLEDASTLRILDFNSAKKIGVHNSTSAMLTDRGTHLYSAPEYRFSGCWNERADIWACGLCLFFMLRAKLPFNIDSRAVRKALLSRKLPDVGWGGVPELMKNIIEQCLTVNMPDRPTAMELLQHPLFNGCTSPISPTAGLLEKSSSDSFCCWQDERSTWFHFLLPSCGLVVLQANYNAGTAAPQCHSAFVRAVTEMPQSNCLVSDWKERRNSFDMLRRLVRNRCHRTMACETVSMSFGKQVSGADGDLIPVPLQVPPCSKHSRFFSTHGAAQDSEPL